MPAILTHDFFGKDAFELICDEVGFTTQVERDAFLLGNQGPDPLFYLVAAPTIPASNRVGELMHNEAPAKLFESLRCALGTLDDDRRRIGDAYAAGFICHYLLDRAEHPLVFAQEYEICDAGIDGLDRSDGGVVHVEIERDLDEAVLYMKTEETIATYKPYERVLRADDATLEVIDKLYQRMNVWTYYQQIEPDTLSTAVKAFRRVQRLFYSPGRKKANALAPIERTLGRKRYSLYCAMAHHVRADVHSDFDNRDRNAWVNPFSGDSSCECFWDIYNKALGEVAAATSLFFADGFDLEAAERFTGNVNFSGQPLDSQVAR